MDKLCQHKDCVHLRKVEPGMKKMIPLLKQCLEMEDNRGVFRWHLSCDRRYEHGDVHGALEAIIKAIENPLKSYMGCDKCQEEERKKHYGK